MAFTFFMRDQPTLGHAADHMISYASGRSRIKIWDAGCALGQETYTIAMIFAEKMNPFGFINLRIDATDHDSANNFGDVVTAATYPNDELQQTQELKNLSHTNTDEKFLDQTHSETTKKRHDGAKNAATP
ncbi:MAG: CheR family methyltransferase [Pseudomonadota bacterium]